MENIKEKAVKGFLWRVAQNSGSQLIGFIISIILARLLVPADYGLIAMVTVFINIALVFIHVGFSSSIVQRKELSETDISTLFYCGLVLAAFIYTVLFLCAPLIASFYREPALVMILRVSSLSVVIGALYSVQQALLIRTLEFRKSFSANIIGVLTQGIVGVVMAYMGYGVWALVCSSLTNYIVCAVVMWIAVDWKPSLQFSMQSVRNVFGFSAKMLLSELLNSVFNNIRSIIIGKQYSSADLAYYNKGYQFPTLIMTQVDGAMTTVLFSSLSSIQNDWKDRGLPALRRAMKLSLYLCAPIMLGLFAVAEPLILLLLTDKWAKSVIYVRLGCIICLFWPLSAQRHALNARGKSGVTLKLNIIGKIITLLLLLLTYKHSVELMIASTIMTSSITLVISMFVYRKYLEYPIHTQICDIAPPILLSVLMSFGVWGITLLKLSSMITLILQVITGIVLYVLLSIVFRMDSFFYLLAMIKSALKRAT